jgi:3-hydroxybutyryl-CoA dehydrogenase
MGSGIAQVAAQNGCEVVLYDTRQEALDLSKTKLSKVAARLVEKGKWTEEQSETIQNRIQYVDTLYAYSDSNLIIEAIVEDLSIKKSVFKQLESIVSEDCILATNTSSLSVASIGSALDKPERIVGIHFFNPAPLMPLVEIIPAVQTSDEVLQKSRDIIDSWKKVTVIAKDTPGFIVNRVARPFYGEALRIYEEGVADFATIDWAMKDIGKFRMGPFELMDFIGNDVNYKVTESVFEAFYYDPRYRPSFTQKRHSEAGWFGRKSGRGYYNYAEGATTPEPQKDREKGQAILNRILVMLINEAVDAVFLNVATAEDVDLAMTNGVNYPKGLLKWVDEIGLEDVLKTLERLQAEYGEDRYRPSPLLRRMVREGKRFYD